MKKLNHPSTHDGMHISDKRLAEFVDLFEVKTGRKLEKQQALARAKILLRSISLLYQPVSTSAYYSAIAKKMFLKTKRLSK